MTIRRKIYFLMACAIISIAAVLLLQHWSKDINQFSTNFVRIFPSHVIDNPRAMQLPEKNFYIAGVADHQVFLANLHLPLHYLSVSYPVMDSISHIFPLQEKPPFFGLPQLRIDKGIHYLVEENVPYVIIKNEHTDNIYTFPIPTPVRPLSLWLPISESSFITRIYDSTLQQNVLVKVSVDSPSIIYNRTILTKQVDGFFCTDGMLLFEKKRNHLLYVYYYRNQLLVLDTNLQNIGAGYTIDTFRHANIETNKIVSPGHTRLIMSRPPFYVNKRSCINAQRLYIQSAVRADNEQASSFKRNAVIDVYDTENLHYKYSFYIPHYNNQHLSAFAVDQNVFVALYEDIIVWYQLNL